MLGGLVVPSVYAAPSYLTRTADGGYRVTYDYQDKAKTGWYVGARAELGLWNWTNKYSLDPNASSTATDNDRYSFEPVFGGSVFGGTRIKYFWRLELEAGYLGYFEDKDASTEFTMQIPYALLNAYYDFNNGLYLGIGVGAAMPITTIDAQTWADGSDRKHYGFAPMAGVMLGYAHKLDDNLILDLRYRLSGMTGSTQRIDLTDGHWVENKIDFVLDNSISVGLRYEF